MADRSYPKALPLLKLQEHLLKWINHHETEAMLNCDITAIRNGEGDRIYMELITERFRRKFVLNQIDEEDCNGESSDSRELSSGPKLDASPTSLQPPQILNCHSPGELNSADVARGTPIGSARTPPLIRPNTILPSGPRSPGLPPLSPDSALSPRHLRSPISFDNFKKLNEYVPRFYWPEGKPPPTPYINETLSKVEGEFSKFTNGIVPYEEFGKFLDNIGICIYWKRPFWIALGLKNSGILNFDLFSRFYEILISECPDEASRFMRILYTARMVMAQSPILDICQGIGMEVFPIDFKKIQLTMSDFVEMIQDIVDTHPGLDFLRKAPEFHSRYVTTVISRIFYKVNRSWTGKLSLSEVRRSNLLRVIKRVQEEVDVNTITEYFSYEHFYVIYCKFWELDRDHDLLIDKTDLARHSDQALSSLIIERIFSGTVLRGWDMNSTTKYTPGKMTYSDFVWFILSEEDKKTSTAIEYWFRCLDLDGDGVLSQYELQVFYREQERRIEALGIEPLDFTNVFCQMVDMLRCSTTGIRLKDLKKNPQLASNIFNTLFNLDKYLDHEQRDPFASVGTTCGPGAEVGDGGESDWDRYAANEYELLIAEESPNDPDHLLHDLSDFEDIPT